MGQNAWRTPLPCQPACYIGNGGYFMKCGGKSLLIVALLSEDSRQMMKHNLTIPKICSQLI
jgi:hypothetical protein